MNWRIDKLLLPSNFYYGAKYIPLLSQGSFHMIRSYWRPFHFDQTSTKLYVFNNLGIKNF